MSGDRIPSMVLDPAAPSSPSPFSAGSDPSTHPPHSSPHPSSCCSGSACQVLRPHRAGHLGGVEICWAPRRRVCAARRHRALRGVATMGDMATCGSSRSLLSPRKAPWKDPDGRIISATIHADAAVRLLDGSTSATRSSPAKPTSATWPRRRGASTASAPHSRTSKTRRRWPWWTWPRRTVLQMGTAASRAPTPSSSSACPSSPAPTSSRI